MKFLLHLLASIFLAILQVPRCHGLVKIEYFREEGDGDSSNVQQDDVSSALTSIRASMTKSPLKFKVDPSTLAVRASEISGNSSFARRLEEESERQNNNPKNFQTGSTTTTSTTTIVLEHHPLVYAGILAVMGGSMIANGSWKVLKETFFSVISMLAMAWIPALAARSSWMELLTFATVFLRPSVRQYLKTEIWPMMGSTLRKLILGEVWKQVWLVLMAPLPKPLLIPRSKDYYTALPHWMQKGIEKLNKYVDKFSQRMVQKVAEQNVYETFGGVFSSMTDSIFEMSIIYDDDSAPDAEIEASEPEDDMMCEGGVCQL